MTKKITHFVGILHACVKDVIVRTKDQKLTS